MPQRMEMETVDVDKVAGIDGVKGETVSNRCRGDQEIHRASSLASSGPSNRGHNITVSARPARWLPPPPLAAAFRVIVTVSPRSTRSKTRPPSFGRSRTETFMSLDWRAVAGLLREIRLDDADADDALEVTNIRRGDAPTTRHGGGSDQPIMRTDIDP